MRSCIHIILAGLFGTLLIAGVLAGDVVHRGGPYDGYDRLSVRVALDYPTVNNAAGATNVTSTGAWLNGVLLATGSASTVVQVFWGTADGGTNRSGWANTNSVGEAIEGVSLTVPVSVTPNTRYYYRFFATNSAGEVGWASESASFVSPSAPQLNTSGGALPLSRSTATLNGNLTAGLSARITVFWGQNTNVWSNTNALGVRGEGPFRVAVANLTAGAVYFYRCYATNDYGVAWSAVVPFVPPVSSAIFRGGSCDGYDRVEAFVTLTGIDGTVFLLQ